MAGDVTVKFNVSCGAEGASAGLDGNPEDIAMLMISIQWEGMEKPVYLWAPAYRAPPAEGGGDDTADVAKSIAGAVYSKASMGDIPKDHVEDISILVDQDPDDPASRGKTNGLLILRNITHFDLRCTEAKIHFTVLFERPDNVPGDVKNAELPKPHEEGYRPIPDRPIVQPWESKPTPPRKRLPPRKPGDGKGLNRGVHPPWAKKWWRIPIRPRFRQWTTRSRPIRAYGSSTPAAPWGGGAEWSGDHTLLRQQGRVLTQQVLAGLKAQGVAAGVIDQQIIVYQAAVVQLEPKFGIGRQSGSGESSDAVLGHPTLDWLIINFDELVGWPVTRIHLVPTSMRTEGEGHWTPWSCRVVPPIHPAIRPRSDASPATPSDSDSDVETRPDRHAAGRPSKSLPREPLGIQDGEGASSGQESTLEQHGRSDAR